MTAIDPSSPGYRIGAFAFNALTCGLGERGIFVPLEATGGQ